MSPRGLAARTTLPESPRAAPGDTDTDEAECAAGPVSPPLSSCSGGGQFRAPGGAADSGGRGKSADQTFPGLPLNVADPFTSQARQPQRCTPTQLSADGSSADGGLAGLRDWQVPAPAGGAFVSVERAGADATGPAVCAEGLSSPEPAAGVPDPPAPRQRAYVPVRFRGAADAAAAPVGPAPDPYLVSGAPAAVRPTPGLNMAVVAEPPPLYSQGLPEPLGLPAAGLALSDGREEAVLDGLPPPLGSAAARRPRGRPDDLSGYPHDGASTGSPSARSGAPARDVPEVDPAVNDRWEAEKRRWDHAGVDRGLFGSAPGMRHKAPARPATPPRAPSPQLPPPPTAVEVAIAEGRKPTWSEVAQSHGQTTGRPSGGIGFTVPAAGTGKALPVRDERASFSWADATDEEDDEDQGPAPQGNEQEEREEEGEWPEGLEYIDAFITEQEEDALLNWAERRPWEVCPRSGRRSQQYGFVLDSASGRLTFDPSRHLPKLPAEVVPRMRKIPSRPNQIPPSNPLQRCPNQLLVTENGPGQGAPPVIDRPQVFDPWVSVISLGADAEVDFIPLDRARARGCRTYRLPVRRRSYMCIAGAARRDYKYAVVERPDTATRMAMSFRAVRSDIAREARAAAELTRPQEASRHSAASA
eukprot:TRINITY_DN4605_c2_g2_i1.p2 TRINITY_DN4605_c2_g2~~TRINITY_DN4605_c2_g2_i1.p2  ORF type:complete len:643 (+),score=150.39 TRINITY_DN4605_c2_g2_i1:507-2435(+)